MSDVLSHRAASFSTAGGLVFELFFANHVRSCCNCAFIILCNLIPIRFGCEDSSRLIIFDECIDLCIGRQPGRPQQTYGLRMIVYGLATCATDKLAVERPVKMSDSRFGTPVLYPDSLVSSEEKKTLHTCMPCGHLCIELSVRRAVSCTHGA